MRKSAFTSLALLVVLFSSACSFADLGFDDRFFDYSFSSNFGRKGASRQIISIDLDPQDLLNSSFRMAAREGRFEDLKSLLLKGADLNSKSESGESALIYSAKNCYSKITEYLLQKGAEINIKDALGRTALIHASAGSCTSVVDLLLKSPKVEIDSKDRAQKTAYDYAIDNSILEVDGPSQKIIQSIFEKRKKKFIQQFASRVNS